MSGAIPTVELWVAYTFLPILAVTAFFDLREMRIPNWLSWQGLALFAFCLPILGIDVWGVRALVGACAFAVCFGLYAMGWLGGGDAKIFPVTMLFVPISVLPLYMFSFSAAMCAGMIGIWCARSVYASPDSNWVSMKPGAAFPMGISIAGSLPLALLAANAF